MLQVRSRYEAMSQCKAAEARAEILQRTIALVFRDVMLSSHFGMEMTLPDGLVMNINPRLILYVSDQPEERDDVCPSGMVARTTARHVWHAPHRVEFGLPEVTRQHCRWC